jgi:hypothetical protein
MKVQVYVYDLTRGMAASLSPMLLGTPVSALQSDGQQQTGAAYQPCMHA